MTTIPEHLLDQANRPNFVAWLCALPIPLSAKWNLKRLWEDHTGLRLTTVECSHIRQTYKPATNNVQN